MILFSHDLLLHLQNSLCLLAFASDILTATLFPHFIHFLFLDFSSSMLYQLCMLLVLDEDDAMFIIILYYGCVDYRITVNMKKELLRCYLWVMVKIDCVSLMEKEMWNFSRFDKFIWWNSGEKKGGYVAC